MNQIESIFKNLNDDELRTAISEMIEDDKSGIIRYDGYVRQLTEKVVEITNQPYSTQLFLTTISLYKEAAYRFVNNNSK